MIMLAASTLAAGCTPLRTGIDRLSEGSLAERLTESQNSERRLVGLQPLSWDAALAAAADEYAIELAATDKWEHSAHQRRKGQGENLWMGTRAAFTPEEMVGEWLAERRMFQSGMFPRVSTSGSWHDVGHYTQIIWADTLKVGCAVRSSPSYDYLVCRYSAPGNVMGERVGPINVASR